MLPDNRGPATSSDDYHHRLQHNPYPTPNYTYKHQTPPSSPSRCCVRYCSKQRLCCCCYCPSKLSSSACTCFGVCVLVLGYTLLGAFTFMALEGGFSQKDTATATSTQKNSHVLGEDIRSKTVEKLWSITEDLNILYKDNWTRLAAQEVLKFQDTLVRNLRGYGSGSAAVVVKNVGGGGGTGNGGSMYYNHHHHRWSFSSSFLYSLTLITTIGYGSVAPRTAWGKVITIVYALIGIPLMLVYLSTVGEVLARSFRRLYGRIFCSSAASAASNNATHHKNQKHAGGGGGGGGGKAGKLTNQSQVATSDTYLNTSFTTQNSKQLHNNIGQDGGTKIHHQFHVSDSCASEELSKMEHGSNVMILDCGGEGLGAGGGHASLPTKHSHQEVAVRVPITLCLFIIILYICGGAVLFNKLENWTFLEGSYFCFTSLGTIGFGDLVPGLYHSYQIQYQSTNNSYTLEQISIFASSAYILVGMALIAMCFNLVQEEVVIFVRRFGKYFGVSSQPYMVKGGDDEDIQDDSEGIAMAVVGSGNTS